jgi:hypothetical protein
MREQEIKCLFRVGVYLTVINKSPETVRERNDAKT